MQNPYPEFIEDGAAGIQVRDTRHQIWEDCKQSCLQALKEIVEYRQGPFLARFSEDANMAVIYKERMPELFRS